MNHLDIYSNKWFQVSEWAFVEDAPCAQMINFRSYHTLEKALEKLEELWKSYRVIDHRWSYWILENIEAKEYAD